MKQMDASKEAVAKFWDSASCGEDLYLRKADANGYRQQAIERYRLEPYIEKFAEFERWSSKDVLEVGIGLGADHERFAAAGARLTGIDLTSRAVEHVQRRLELRGLTSTLVQADAEALPFQDASFDFVYSWGVIHHSPNTARAAQQILRVLRAGGEFRAMIYHRMSLVGFMLWLRYGMPNGLGLDEVYSRYLESPGTKAYSCEEGMRLFDGATNLRTKVILTHADLLESGAGQRHQGAAMTIARSIWPRRLLRRCAQGLGLFLLISGRKPSSP